MGRGHYHVHHACAVITLLIRSPWITKPSKVANYLITQYTHVMSLWRSAFGHRLTWNPQLPPFTKQLQIDNLPIAQNLT